MYLFTLPAIGILYKIQLHGSFLHNHYDGNNCAHMIYLCSKQTQTDTYFPTFLMLKKQYNMLGEWERIVNKIYISLKKKKSCIIFQGHVVTSNDNN